MSSEHFTSCGQNLAIRNKLQLVSVSGNPTHTAFGAVSIPSTSKHIYKWYFEIYHQNSKMAIGISNGFTNVNAAFQEDTNSINYAYNCYSGNKVSCDNYSSWATSCKSGSILCMTLNLIKKELSYSVNGKDLGVAYRNIAVSDAISYVLSIGMRGHATNTSDMTKNDIRLIGLHQFDNDSAMIAPNQDEKSNEEEKLPNNDGGIQSVLNKLDNESVKFREKFTESKLQSIMKQAPQQILDKQSELNQELKNYKQCVDGIIMSSKSLSKHIQDANSMIDKLSKPDLANYKNWTVDTIIIWIGGLENGRFVKYVDVLRRGMIESEIKGSDLPDLDRGDLTRPPFRIKNFRDKKDLEDHFKSLSVPQTVDQNEGAPTAFIGQ